MAPRKPKIKSSPVPTNINQNSMEEFQNDEKVKREEEKKKNREMR